MDELYLLLRENKFKDIGWYATNIIKLQHRDLPSHGLRIEYNPDLSVFSVWYDIVGVLLSAAITKDEVITLIKLLCK